MIERDQNGQPIVGSTTSGAMQIRDPMDDGSVPAEVAETSGSCMIVEGGEPAIDHYAEHRVEMRRVDEHREQYWRGVMDANEWATVRKYPPVNGPKTDAVGLIKAGEDDDG